MSRLQVGGLALVLNSRFPENIGKVVKLVRHAGLIESEMYGTVDFWVVNGELKGTISDNTDGVVPTKYLMPLGDKQGQDEIMKEKELEYLK